MSKRDFGKIGWIDLTIEDAPAVRDFYSAVAGWSPHGVDMGGYEDYSMIAPGGDCVGGICHARGANEGLPAQWLIYITVEDLDAAMKAATENGGEIVRDAREMGGARFCVVRDPGGAVAALFQPAPEKAEDS